MKTSNCFYIASDQAFQEKSFRPMLEEVVGHRITLQVIQKFQWAFFSTEDAKSPMQSFLDTYQQEHNVKIHLLKSYRLHALGEKASLLGLKVNPGKVDHLGDFLVQLMIEGNRQLIPFIQSEFANVPRHLMQTASMLLVSDMNATIASQRLYVHRNTFAYRLRQFITLTGLDIRIHDHALFFTLAEKLLMQRN
jgi:hypothetical protein